MRARVVRACVRVCVRVRAHEGAKAAQAADFELQNQLNEGWRHPATLHPRDRRERPLGGGCRVLSRLVGTLAWRAGVCCVSSVRGYATTDTPVALIISRSDGQTILHT